HPPRLGLRLGYETSRKEGAATTERALARGRRLDRAVAGALQHPLGGTRVLGLEPAIEGIDEEHDLGARSRGNVRAIGTRAPGGQFALGAQAREALPHCRERLRAVS